MVGSSMLQKVNQKSARIWSVATTSDAIIGGLPVAICLGDFEQFEPIKDTALWKTEKTATDAVKDGQNIWKKFTNVIHLTEQMRQKDDVEYQRLLGRAKECTLTHEDIQLLNTRSKHNLVSKNMRVPERAIRPKNDERQVPNDSPRDGTKRSACLPPPMTGLGEIPNRVLFPLALCSMRAIAGSSKAPAFFSSRLECLLCFWRTS